MVLMLMAGHAAAQEGLGCLRTCSNCAPPNRHELAITAISVPSTSPHTITLSDTATEGCTSTLVQSPYTVTEEDVTNCVLTSGSPGSPGSCAPTGGQTHTCAYVPAGRCTLSSSTDFHSIGFDPGSCAPANGQMTHTCTYVAGTPNEDGDAWTTPDSCTSSPHTITLSDSPPEDVSAGFSFWLESATGQECDAAPLNSGLTVSGVSGTVLTVQGLTSAGTAAGNCIVAACSGSTCDAGAVQLAQGVRTVSSVYQKWFETQTLESGEEVEVYRDVPKCTAYCAGSCDCSECVSDVSCSCRTTLTSVSSSGTRAAARPRTRTGSSTMTAGVSARQTLATRRLGSRYSPRLRRVLGQSSFWQSRPRSSPNEVERDGDRV